MSTPKFPVRLALALLGLLPAACLLLLALQMTPLAAAQADPTPTAVWTCWPNPDQCGVADAQGLNAVDLLPTNEGWAVGQDGAILRWDGTSWKRAASPQARALYDVATLSPTDAWAVGDRYPNSPILRWDGTEWRPFPSPNMAVLRAITMRSPSDGWAVGDMGAILRWDGASWRPVASPTPLRLLDVAMLSATDGWAVGEGVILRWDGAAWTVFPNPAPDNIALRAVDLLDATHGWIVGDQSFILRWDGAAWSRVESPTGWWLTDVKLLSATNGWAVGDRAFLHWDGTRWTSAGGPRYGSNSLDFVSPTDGWAVGWGGARYHWDGQAWGLAAPARDTDLLDVAMSASGEGWIVGENGVTLRWDGTDWVGAASPPLIRPAVASPGKTGAYPPPDALYGVASLGPDAAWAVGDGGRLQHWDGQRWSLINSPTTKPLYDVAMISATDGWAIGGDLAYYGTSALLRLDGQEWTEVALESMRTPLLGISMSSPEDGWAVGGGGWDVYHFGNVTLHWNGVSWNSTPNPTRWPLRSVVALSPTDAWAVGGNPYSSSEPNGVIIHWDGSQWRVGSIPPSPTLNKIAMASATDGWAVGNNGTLLHWDGVAWTQAPSPTTTRLWGVALVSPTDGWAVGEDGVILRLAVPQPTPTPTPTPRYTTRVHLPLLTQKLETWRRVWLNYPLPEGCCDGLYGLKMVGLGDGWAVGYGGAILRWDGSRWNRVASPTTEQLLAVDVVSNSESWAVGAGGVILRWNGTAWTQVASPTTNALRAVDMLSSNEGWAVGDGGVVLRWDGAAWSQVASGTTNALHGVSMLSSSAGLIVGDNSTVLRWDGATWTPMAVPRNDYALRGVAMLAPNDAFAVGSYWVQGGCWIRDCSPSYNVGVLLRWDGAAWREVGNVRGPRLNALTFRSSSEGWVVGDAGAAYFWNGGALQGVANAGPANLYAVTFGYEPAAPDLGIGVWVAGAPGVIKRYWIERVPWPE